MTYLPHRRPWRPASCSSARDLLRLICKGVGRQLQAVIRRDPDRTTRRGAEIGLMVRTAVSTGMRVSEIIGLKWRAVDLEHGLVHVQERYYRGDTDEPPKTDKSKRPLPLGYLVKEFRELRSKADAERQKLGGHEYVFHKEDGKPLDDRDVLRDIIRPAAERLDLYFEGFGWHSFRRQNITLMQEEGATTFEATEQAGHPRSTMTSHYTMVALTRREQERLSDRRRKGPDGGFPQLVRDNAG